MSKKLFDDSDDNLEEDNFQIKTNENYAKSYNNLRKKELLQKFKDKGLEVSESESDDSDSSEEDEVLDPSFDQEFLKTLASLKSKDPAIYDKNTKFFENDETDDESDGEEGESNKTKEKKSKPVTLKDYERKIILEKGGKFEDDTDEENEEEAKRPLSPTVVEEERRLKAEFKKVINQEDSSDEEFGGIFKKREKTKAEKDKEEEDYLKWLAGKKETIEEEVKQKLEPLKKYWDNDKLPSSEKFLRDYVLNKGYTEATNYNEIPTYEEIVGDNAPLSEDEQELEKQEEFEHKFNFRYEEPDQEFIKRYPRTIESSLRLSDDKRKKKRQETKERKLQEKQQKMKELEMVKEMKRKEIQEKIEKLKLVTGNDELGFKDDDLEEDFDPEAHDRRMKELFNDEYYQVDEGEEKPDVPSDIEELKVEDWDNYNPEEDDYNNDGNYDYNDNEPHCEDEDFNMDCDYDPTKAKEELQKELIENTKRRRGGRKGRRDRFMEIIKAEKPVFDPEDEKTYGEYIDEYYKLDCEDIIGDIPCRFKYVETTPNDFGLTIEEILLAKNKELNQWASLKKAIQIRPDYVEKKEQRLYKMKAKNEELKRKIFKSLYGEGSDEENEADETKEQSTSNTETEKNNDSTNPPQGESKKAKKRRKRKAQNAQAAQQINVNGEQDNGINKSNEENKQKDEEHPAKKPKIEEDKKVEGGANNNLTEETTTEVNKKKKKKNKKKQQNQDQSGHINNNEENKLSNNTATTTNSNQDNKNDKNPFGKEQRTKQAQQTNNSNNDSKPLSKNNPFAKNNKHTDTLPPLRKNLPKTKTFNGKFKTNDKVKANDKFKSKFQNKKPFNGKHKAVSTGDGKEISDERLKAYGINPRKFHKKQKYGNAANKSTNKS